MADTGAESVFGEAVERMLFLDSVEAVRTAADAVPATRRDELFSAFDAAAAHLDRAATAELELVSFVRHIVEATSATTLGSP